VPENVLAPNAIRNQATPHQEPSPVRSLLVVLSVCTVCSLIVSATSVLLKPVQRAHRERERRDAVRALIERRPGLSELLTGAGAHDVHEWVLDLATGEVANWIDPSAFDARRAAVDPLTSSEIPSNRDRAGLGRRADHATALAVLDDDDRALLLILPVHGQGYGGPMHGYVALDGDGNTMLGLSIHKHSETPGVGGALLEDEDWLAEWQGKRIRDAEGRVRIGVAVQELDPESEAARYEIDAVTGATMTSGGVGNVLNFWLGDDGYGPFLARVRRGDALR
jgi:Na+-transporting NADH:ubiquinone oxidoreductase subunit C